MRASATQASVSASLDGSLEAALRAACPDGPDFVLLTFSNLALEDHVRNFVAHVRSANVAFVLGAIDAATFDAFSQRTPVYKTPLAVEGYALDGSNQHSSGSWKRFAGMRTGEVAKIVTLGYSVLHTDVDVIWLRDPMPFLMCRGAVAAADFGEGARFPCKPMLEADVAVSSDNMSPGRDTAGRAGYSAGGTFNTGILFIRGNERGAEFARNWHQNVVSPKMGSRFAPLTSDQQVFNNMMRKEREWPGISGSQGASVMYNWDKSVRLGSLPLALFMNGHGYFVQRADLSLGTKPLAVHATYSLDAHDGVSKRQRFREAGLWRASPEDYFQGRFLAFNATVAPPVQARIDLYAAKGETPNNIDVHARALTAYMAELRDALALATALGRILVLPRWICYCDRLWSASDDLFASGCMYPGSQDGKFAPFTCPMDHVLSPGAWERAKVPFRDAAFLEEERFRRSGAVAEVAVIERGAAGSSAASDAARGPRLRRRSSLEEARAALEAFEHVPVLRLPHARGIVCAIGDSAQRAAVNQMVQGLVRVPPWGSRCYSPCASELKKWLSDDEISRGVSHWSKNDFSLRLDAPAPFQERCAAV